MIVKVMIPTALRQYTGGSDTVEVAGDRVGEVLTRLGEAHPDLKRHLFSDAGELRSFVNVFVNDENIRDREKQATLLREGDEVMIIPAVAGGAGQRS